MLDAVSEIEDGRGAFVLVSGGTREAREGLLSSLARAGAPRGAEVLRLRAHPFDAIVPYGTVQPWLAQWYDPDHDPSPKTRASFSMPLIGLILGLPPDGLVEGSPTSGEGTAAGGADPARSFSPAELRSELVEMVEGRTRQAPALVLVEDADFLDPASCAWFAFLGSRIGKLPLLVAFSLDHELAAWKNRLGRTPALDCPLGADGAPGSREDGVRARLRGLSPRALYALGLAVLGGPDASPGLLQRILGCSEPELLRLLAPVLEQGLLRRNGGRFELPFPELFPDLLGVLGASQRAAAHRALAVALAARPGSAQGQLLFRLSEHWAEAGEVARGIPSLLAAAKEAERWGAPDLAAQRLLRAVRLAQSDFGPAGRGVEESTYAELAALRLRAGQPREAVEAYQRALSLAKARGGSAVEWGRYVAGIADAEAGVGGHPEELLKATLAEVGERSSDVKALLLRSLSFYYIERARFHEATEIAEEACLAADQGRDALLKVQCHSTAARSHLYVGDRHDEARAHLLKALEHRPALEGTADQVMIVGLLDGLSLLECGVGNERAALNYGEEALAMARRCGYGTSFLWVLGNLAEEHIHAKELERAQELVEEFRALLVRLSVPERDSLHQQMDLLDGRLAFERGELATARECFQRMVQDSAAGGSRILLAQALVHLVVLETRAGERKAAQRHLDELRKAGLDRTLMGETHRLLDAALSNAGPV